MSFWLPVAGAAISGLSGLLADTPDYDMVTNEELSKDYSDFKSNLDVLKNEGNQLIDPNSSFNFNQAQRIKNMGYDNLAFANMLNNRNFNQGGMGGFSGIQNQQTQASTDRAQQQILNNIENMYSQNYTKGLETLFNTNKGLLQYGNIMGQNRLNNQAIQNQFSVAQSQMPYQAMFGLGQGLLNYGLLNAS